MSRFSTSHATAGSMMEIAEVHAAKVKQDEEQHAEKVAPGHAPEGDGQGLEHQPRPLGGRQTVGEHDGENRQPRQHGNRVSARAMVMDERVMESCWGR